MGFALRVKDRSLSLSVGESPVPTGILHNISVKYIAVCCIGPEKLTKLKEILSCPSKMFFMVLVSDTWFIVVK